jgi:hypothetical protein
MSVNALICGRFGKNFTVLSNSHPLIGPNSVEKLYTLDGRATGILAISSVGMNIASTGKTKIFRTEELPCTR